MILSSKERKQAEYMYNLGKRIPKLSKKGKKEFKKIVKDKKRLPKRLVLICFTHKSGDWLCWWESEKEVDKRFKKNIKKYKNKRKSSSLGVGIKEK